MRKILVVLIILALFVACSPSRSEIVPVSTSMSVAQATATSKPTDVQTVTPINTPELTVTPKPTVAPMVTPTLTRPSGLGITRADAARMYQLFEFKFENKTGEQGQENYVGTISDNLAVVKLVGPKENITSASVIITVPKPPTQNQSARTMTYLATLLTVVANDWSDGTDWLSKSLNKTGESRTTFDNREVILVVTPQDNQTVVEFSINAK